MLCRLSYETDIRSSQCDYSGRLGVAQCFDLFMDLATQHADALGIGRKRLDPEGLAWVITKSIVKVYRMPEMSERVEAATWPAQPSGVHCDRYYTLKDAAGKLLACGKTEWVNMDLNTGRLSPVARLFSEDTEFCTECPVPENFTRIKGEFPAEPFASHPVRTGDLDVNRHVNNTKYVYALLDCFDTAELKARPVKAMEVLYKNQAREGDTLEFFRRTSEDGAEEYRVTDGQDTAVFAKIWR